VQEHLPGIPVERWAAVPGFPRYEVSDRGRVRRIPRTLQVARDGGVHERHLEPLCLRARMQAGRLQVRLDAGDGSRRIRGVARLMLSAFAGEPPKGWVARAGDPANPSLQTTGWAAR
jgi:hypothetical protein